MFCEREIALLPKSRNTNSLHPARSQHTTLWQEMRAAHQNYKVKSEADIIKNYF
jgi:hypothetical protein